MGKMDRRYGPMEVFPLSAEMRTELEYAYRSCDSADMRTRCHIVLLYDEGRSASELAELFKLSEDTILRAIARFRNGGIAALANKPHPGRAKTYSPEDERLVVDTIRQSPRSLGLSFSNWTIPTLSEYVSLRLGKSIGYHPIFNILHAHKINLRRAKLKVTSPDPDYTEKRGSWKAFSIMPPPIP
jgi:transposase